MNRNPSEYIDEFLTFLREAWSEHYMAGEQQDEANKETQDILHWIEFQQQEPRPEVSARIQAALHTVRQDRREAKDWETITGPVVDWISENEPVRKSLEELLGEVRKAEKRTQNRCYMEKTNIMTEILGPPKEAAKDGQEA